MNISSFLPDQNQMRTPLSDEELRRLAAMLQDKGEGLAAINPQEAQMLKDAGGSGKPLPGTMGLGVQGGPIRSYDPDDDTRGPEDSGSGENNREESSFSSDYGYQDDGSYNYTPSEQAVVNEAIRQSQSGGGDSSSNNRPYVPPKPTYGPDDDDGMHFTKAELDAANSRIRLRKAGENLKTEAKTFTSDQTFERWYAKNKASYEGVAEDDLRKLFDDEMLEVSYEGIAQSAQLKERIVNKFNNRVFNASGQRVRNEDGTITDVIPTDFADADRILSAEDFDYARLSEAQRRALYDDAMDTFTRENRFTLTTEDVDVFKRDAPQMDDVDDAEITEITETPQADGVTVGDVADAGRTEIIFTPEIERDYIDKVRANENELVDILKRRVAGEAPSPAEQQFNRQTEKNVSLLLGQTAGGSADPGRRRQLQQLFADVQQVATGQAAELRSQEQIAAEGRLVQLYQQQGTQEVSMALAKLAAEKEKAFTQGNLDQAREIAIMETNLSRVATQASLDRDVNLSNLEAKKQILIQNGQMALATRLANLQKQIVISQTNTEVALKSRSLDDALALAAFTGEMQLENAEISIDLAQMDSQLKVELAKLGFDTQEKIAALNRQQQMTLAEMNRAMQQSANNQNQQNAILGAVATVAAAWLKSDRRAKKNIKVAKTKAQDFLDSLKAYSYEYKDPDSPGAKHGEILGIMAQDLEKTSLGKQMVRETPTGKMVDMGQGLAALLASQAYLNDQVKNLAARI